MNKIWAEQNKNMQKLLKKGTFPEGIQQLLVLREELMQEALSWQETLQEADFSAIPFLSAEGYHSKTIAYSLWHIFRIEDIVANTLIRKVPQVFFAGNFQEKTHTPIITTGNELVKEEIADFSQKLDLPGLYAYIQAVKQSTDEWLKTIDYTDLKTTFTDADKAAIAQLNVVSQSEEAAWLIDYWCSKDVKGLIQMPFSRHWIMHIEAALRIKAKIMK